ncbi:barstar family protein [Streptomyces sp. NPDC054849]
MTGRTHVARLDGREMRDTDAVFQQFYDGLRLPDYFGWNWNALSDCLRDLKWLSSDHCVLIVETADEALSGDPSEQRLLFNTCAGRAAMVLHTAARGHRTRQARCCHVLGRPVRLPRPGRELP